MNCVRNIMDLEVKNDAMRDLIRIEYPNDYRTLHLDSNHSFTGRAYFDNKNRFLDILSST